LYFICYPKYKISKSDFSFLLLFFKNEYIQGYKQAHRREDDIAIVNAGIRVLFEGDSDVVKDITMAFGGMAATTVLPLKTMKQLLGR